LELLKNFSLDTEVSSASLQPNKQRFVVGGPDFRVRVHDFESGKEIGMFEVSM
jgi:WD40 repeat protein